MAGKNDNRTIIAVIIALLLLFWWWKKRKSAEKPVGVPVTDLPETPVVETPVVDPVVVVPDPVTLTIPIVVPVPEAPVKVYKAVTLEDVSTKPVYSPGTAKIKLLPGENIERVDISAIIGSTTFFSRSFSSALPANIEMTIPANAGTVHVSAITYFTDNKGKSTNDIKIDTRQKYKAFKLEDVSTKPVYSPGIAKIRFTGGENVDNIALVGTIGSTQFYNHTVSTPFPDIEIPIPPNAGTVQISAISWFKDSAGGSADSIQIASQNVAPVVIPDTVIQTPEIPAKNYTRFLVKRADNTKLMSPGRVKLSLSGGENVERVQVSLKAGTADKSSTIVFAPFPDVELPIPANTTDIDVSAVSWFTDNEGSAEHKFTIYPTMVVEPVTPVVTPIVPNTPVIEVTPVQNVPFTVYKISSGNVIAPGSVSLAFKDGKNVKQITLLVIDNENKQLANRIINSTGAYPAQTVNIPAGVEQIKVKAINIFNNGLSAVSELTIPVYKQFVEPVNDQGSTGGTGSGNVGGDGLREENTTDPLKKTIILN